MAVIIFSLLISLVLMVVSVRATTHIVGGRYGWSPTSDLLGWASRKTISVGDTLVFKYGPNHGVAVVTESDYINCNTGSPISSHSGGKTTITIDKAGPSYFICPTAGHCQGGMKLSINTMSGPGSGSEPGSGSDPGSGTDIPTIPVRDPHSPHGGGFSPPKGWFPSPISVIPSPIGGISSPTYGYLGPPSPYGGYFIPCNYGYGGQGCHNAANGELKGGLVLWFSAVASLIGNILVSS